MKFKKHIFTPRFRSFSANLGEKVFPTKSIYIGANAFATLSSTFFGSIFENSGYLGIPAIGIIIIYNVKYWHEKMTRVLFFILLCFMILSLGPTLHIAGYSTLTLPEYYLNKLPVLTSHDYNDFKVNEIVFPNRSIIALSQIYRGLTQGQHRLGRPGRILSAADGGARLGATRADAHAAGQVDA